MNVKSLFSMRGVFWGTLICIINLLSACASPQQEQSLTQIQSQISVLSNEMRESFQKSEQETVSLYEDLNNDVRVLQKNQADSAASNEQLSASLIALEAKLDEYNSRVVKLNQRLDATERTLTERITSLSGKVTHVRGREARVTPAVPRVSPTPAPIVRETLPTPEEAPTPLPTPATPAANSVDSVDFEASRLYHQAYTLYVNGGFDSAIAGFQKYLERFPDSKFADSSQFWIAESFFSLGEYESALQEYDRLIDQYPSSDKIPDAFYSKADAYLQLDRQIEAISHLQYVISQFPNTDTSQRAKERLQSLTP